MIDKEQHSRRDFLEMASRMISGGAVLRAIPGVAGMGLLSSCAGRRSPEDLKRLVVSVGERIQTFDPAQQSMALDGFVMAQIYDNLTWYNRDLKLVPRLSTGWTTPDNGTTWDFELRKGVKFHDGTPLDAEAVKFHFDRIKDPATKSTRQTKVQRLDRTEAVSTHLIRFHMNTPYSVWPVVLRDAFSSIVSPTAVQKYGNTKYTLNPVGTGPYKFESAVDGQYVRLVKNEHYWDAASYQVEEIEFRVIPESTTSLILLEQGEVDLATVFFTHLDVADESGNVEIHREPFLAVNYIGFNNQKPPFNNPLVRKAANCAINKKELVEFGFRGVGHILNGPLPTAMPSYNKALVPYEFDPEKARALLKQAGYDKPLSVRLWTKDDVVDTNLGVVVAEQLARVGIAVEIIRYERSAYWSKFDVYLANDGTKYPTKEGVFDLFAAGWVGGEHPHGYLDPLFRSTSSSNSSFYVNEEVDQLLKDSLSIADDAERQVIYDKLQAVIVEDAPWIFCFSRELLWGVNKRVSGLRPHPGGEFIMQGVELRLGEGRI